MESVRKAVGEKFILRLTGYVNNICQIGYCETDFFVHFQKFHFRFFLKKYFHNVVHTNNLLPFSL